MNFILLLVCCSLHLWAQPSASFSIKPSACLNERIEIQNQSLNATRFEWDLCQGDLSLPPSGIIAGTATGTNVPTGFDVVFDGAKWYCFVASRGDNSIIRIDLGDDLTAFNSVTDLGNIDSQMNQPLDIKIVNDNNEWYGFVYNESSNIITRLDFGPSLTNAPTATPLLAGSTSTFNQGLDVVRQGSTWYVVYTRNSTVGVLRLPTIETIPDVSNQSVTGNLTGNPSLGDVKILSKNGQFYVYTVSWNSPALYKLTFGSDLFAAPSAQIYNTPDVLNLTYNYFGIDGDHDNGKFYLFLSTLQGAVIRIGLGDDLSQAPLLDAELNLGFANTIKDRLVKHKSSWFIFSVDYTNGFVFKGAFPSPSCTENASVVTASNPVISFTTPGAKHVSLRAFDNGLFAEAHQMTVVSSLGSPDIDFIHQNNCVSEDVLFTSVNQSGDIASYLWEFGDAITATDANPVHIYNTASLYYPSLTVVSTNGCENRIRDLVSIFDPPQASFDLPSGLICTNNQFDFFNQTPDVFAGNLSYQWLIDQVPISTQRDLTYTFTSGGNKEVKLIASIPGCSDEAVQTIPNVGEGPIVGFSIDGKCDGEEIFFTNQSAGEIASYEWDLAGIPTNETSPSTTFANPGQYVVKLKAVGTNGCISETIKPVTIYSKPQPNFSLDLPPFSCAGSPAQFRDNTPVPDDSNLQEWRWEFEAGKAGSGREPLYTFQQAGEYLVKLEVTTDQGCSTTIQKTITIAPSPVPNFDWEGACVNQGARFLDKTTGDVQTRVWKIGTSTYTTAAPTHVFLAPASNNVQLTVANMQGCVASITKTVVVPTVPQLDFTINQPCVGQGTQFTNVTNSPADPVRATRWTWAGGTDENAQATLNFVREGTFPVEMRIENQSGCVYSLTKNITIYPLPVASFSASVVEGAPPLAVGFQNESTGASSFRWTINGQPQSETADLSRTFYTVGDYVVDLIATNENGCAATASELIRVIVPRTEISLRQFNLIEDAITKALRSQVQVQNNSNYTVRSFDVRLDLGNGTALQERVEAEIEPGASASVLLRSELATLNSGYVCAEVVLPNDLTPNDNKACNPLQEEAVLSAPYPNPASDVLRVEVVAAREAIVDLELVNTLGEIATQVQVAVKPGLNLLEIDTRQINPGLYLLMVEIDGQKQVHRVVLR